METRSPSGRRRARRVLRSWPLAVVTVLLATGCLSNFDAPTQEPYQPGPGISDREGDVYVINALVVSGEDGSGTLVGSFVNQQPSTDYLVEMVASDSSGGELRTSQLPSVSSDEGSGGGEAPRTGLTLPSHRAVQLPKDAQLEVSGESVVPGRLVTLEMTFRTGEPVNVEIPVFSEDNSYVGGPIGPTTGQQTSDPTEETPADESEPSTTTSSDEPTASESGG